MYIIVQNNKLNAQNSLAVVGHDAAKSQRTLSCSYTFRRQRFAFTPSAAKCYEEMLPPMLLGITDDSNFN